MLLTLAAVAIASAQVATKPAPETTPAPTYQQLRYPALKPVKIPEPEVVTLSNGIKVFLLEEHELPLVSGFALVRTGNLFDPPEKRGLSEIMASVMRSGGTKARTGDQLDEDLENIAASVESEMGESSATVSFSALKENTPRVLAIFKEVLTQPAFRQDKIDLIKTQIRSSISRRNDDPSGIASRELASHVYGANSPYGWMIEYEHIDRITRDDLVAFHQRYYFPANIRLAVYGDFDAKQMKTQLETLFADWKAQQAAVPPFPQVDKTPHPGIFLASKTDVTQTFFRLGHLGGLLNDKDYPALQVAVDILASGFTSRLVNRVRTKLGYAYEIGGGWGADFSHPGIFQIGGSTKSASTAETIAVIKEEIDRMRTAEVTAAELTTAKSTVLNSFVFRFDQPSKTLTRLVQYDYFGYPKDFVFQYQKAVENVTRADILRVAKEHFHPDRLTIIAVGNPKEFGKPLTSLGTVAPIDLTIPEKPAGKPGQ
jgi:zinc protease